MNDIERAVRENGRHRSGAVPGRRVVSRSSTLSEPGNVPGFATPHPPDEPARRTAPSVRNARLSGTDVDRDGPPARSRPGRAEARTHALPMQALAAAGHLVPDTRKGLLTEQYRHLKRPLLLNLDRPVPEGGDANIVMVTSSVPGEGKTYTAINLAMSLAMERDRTVLLVDADVVKASATHRLGFDEDAPGLIELLNDPDYDAGDFIVSTDVPDLRFLPAGRADERATELLSSGAMDRLMHELATRYPDRLIVLDCPPMLAANEATAVAEHAGQIVFVVAEGKTSQADVDRALDRFEPDRFVGVLMNRARGVRDGAYKYGYE